MDQPTDVRSRQDRLLEALPGLCAVGAVVMLCLANQHSGHDWGDDFALYLRQATAIVDGNVDHVLDANRFTVTHSSWHTFSPAAYPWGWPILIAPIYAIWGLDYGVLKLVEALLFGGFLLCFLSVTTRRVGQIAGFLLVGVIGFGVVYVGWTDTVLSEFPYLCFLGLTFWWHDRCRRRDSFVTGSWWPLIVLGLFAAYTYSIRREGLALVAGLGLYDLTTVLSARRSHPTLPATLRAAPWLRLAVPYAVAIAFVGLLQLLLPSVLFQRYPLAGLGQLEPNVIWFRDILAEQLGLKDQGVAEFELIGSAVLAKTVLGVFVGCAVIGLVARCLTALRDDALLIGYGISVCLIIGVQPFHEGRYLFSITPLLAYFAYHGAATLARPLLGAHATNVAAVFLAVFVVANATDLYRRTVQRMDYGNYVIWGPADPAAVEMFAAVRELSDEDDVISFFRARAMNLYADRPSVQLTTTYELEAFADLYVMERESTYSQVLLTEAEAAELGFIPVWENGRYVIWQQR